LPSGQATIKEAVMNACFIKSTRGIQGSIMDFHAIKRNIFFGARATPDAT
jgi:hypothetical protein